MEGEFEGVPPKIMELNTTTGNPTIALSRMPVSTSASAAENGVESWRAVGLC